jgi:hypothetical protein
MTDKGRPEYEAQTVDVAMSENGTRGVVVINDSQGPITIFFERSLLQRFVDRARDELKRPSSLALGPKAKKR